MNRARILQDFMTFANKIVKKRKLILFNSYPAYSDNSRALYEYIMNYRPDITKMYEIIWGQDKDAIVPETMLHYGIKTINKKSLKGIMTFLSAKYVFSTHGYFPGVKSGNGQVQVNLWHGCGYKSITVNDRIYRGDINTVTGSVYVSIHENVFDMQPGTVYPTGLPRNDLLFSHRQVMQKLGINIGNYKKIYIWMPTYRKANEGHSEVDGNINSFTISTMKREDLEKLNGILQAQHSLLIVKPHPMDSKAFDNVDGFSNILTVTNTQLSDANIQLYELMAETDVLLSDYSSVVIDYLMLRKPIVMVMSDIDDYKNSRGFVFESVKDYLPGPVIADADDLMNYFRNSEEIDNEWTQKRNQLAETFHDYIDDRSCERVCNLIFGASDSKNK